ncbi:NADP-dependent malic enzyme [Tistrella bauzanensis]|uniref:NADP-dependent malic enzyme n=1 Tax=Tistrella arctica TaxID=3133430 RepID=A0ABU9YGH2_9PROT
MDGEKYYVTEQEALEFHQGDRPGKLSITPTKALMTQRDLSLAYSPGVAWPCLHINKDPNKAYDYTSKGNMVAVISNGTAVLGLGNLGALASKPVMEGKAVLFKKFADIDAVDIEVSTEDVDEFVNCVRFLGPTWGGINLEDIRAPECFIIEQRLRELLDVPVFHDDQHGTAIISAAGLINALEITGKSIRDVRMVVNGAGSAGIACLELVKAMGLPHENAILCDSQGVIYQGREKGMNQWKSAHAVETDARTLADALKGADVVFGLSVKGAFTPEMLASMAPQPIIFAMANPDPEITPEEVAKVRSDAIVATGRSDYPNQVNNVLGFPYIFRGALDVRATEINEQMKIAAAYAIAGLAREDVPDEVARAYGNRRMQYGRDYIIPAPFDPRLMTTVPLAVAKAATETGVARKPLVDRGRYVRALRARLDPTADSLERIIERVHENPKRVVFAEGEEEQTIRAATQWAKSGLGKPVLIGREEHIKASMLRLGLGDGSDLEIDIHNARLSDKNKAYTDFLYARLQRRGYLYRDVQRLVNQDRNVFGACMVACGDGDALITGLTRNYWVALENVQLVIDPEPDQRLIGLSVMVSRGRTIMIADTTVNELPEAEALADIAIQAAASAKRFGLEPRVAMLSYSNFGNPHREKADRIRAACRILESRGVDFEFDGEMSADVALDHELMQRYYPFCKLTGPANVLIMPGLHSANISAMLLQNLGGAVQIGPLLRGMSKPVQIVQMGATVAEMVNIAAVAAHDALVDGQEKAHR